MSESASGVPASGALVCAQPRLVSLPPPAFSMLLLRLAPERLPLNTPDYAPFYDPGAALRCAGSSKTRLLPSVANGTSLDHGSRCRSLLGEACPYLAALGRHDLHVFITLLRDLEVRKHRSCCRDKETPSYLLRRYVHISSGFRLHSPPSRPQLSAL
jgi:hypothetical protein